MPLALLRYRSETLGVFFLAKEKEKKKGHQVRPRSLGQIKFSFFSLARYNTTLVSRYGRYWFNRASSVECYSAVRRQGAPNTLRFSRVCDTGQGTGMPSYKESVREEPYFSKRLTFNPGRQSFGAYSCEDNVNGSTSRVVTTQLPNQHITGKMALE